MNQYTPTSSDLENHLEDAWRELAIQRAMQQAVPASPRQAIILGGQPGSGKSVLTQCLQQSCRQAGSVLIDSEELLLTHPAFPIFGQAERQSDLDDLRSEAADLAARLLVEACELGCHVLLATRFQSVEAAELLLDHLRTADYDVQVVAVAIGARQSRNRLAVRCRRTDDVPLVRSTRPEEHDALFDQWLNVLDWIERTWPVNRLQLFAASGRPLLSATVQPEAGTCRQIYADVSADQTDSSQPTSDSTSRSIFGSEIDHPRLATSTPQPTLSDDEEVIAQRRRWQAIIRRAAESESV